jgi:hypothetical protein
MRNGYVVGAALLGLSCAGSPKAPADKRPAVAPTDAALRDATPVKPLPSPDIQKKVDAALDAFFARTASRRTYIMTDKPLYQPGETVWFRVDLRNTATFTAMAPSGITVELVTPRGATAVRKRVLVQNGFGANDFLIPAEAEGGEFEIRVAGDEGSTDKRKIVVQTYDAPRLKKELEFVRKAYGPGDSVTAAVTVKRQTGEPLANQRLTGVVTIDDAEWKRVSVTTDADGKASLKFDLPTAIARGDGLLTLLADDGGVTESMQKRIPIVLKELQVGLFPEGGDLVEGLPGRVYFRAQNALGKPADVDGRVVDDRGQTVAELASVHDGMGRFDFTPAEGRSYRVELSKPVAQKIDIPAAKPGGCVLRAVDSETIAVAAFCTDARTILAAATLREKRVASGAFAVQARKPAVLELPVEPGAQGVVRVTLFDDKLRPLAERLVYRGRGANLKVEVSADHPRYSPRDPVTLTVKTSDAAGRPVEANLGLAVVDDTVLSFADDKTANIYAHLYLEPELDGQTVDEPNFYFGDKPEATAALDALLGARGWRKFEWQQVWSPPPPPPPVATTAAPAGAMPEDVIVEGALVKDAERERPKQRPMPMKKAGKPVADATPPAPAAPLAEVRMNGPIDHKPPVDGKVKMKELAIGAGARARMEGRDRRGQRADDDGDQMEWGWAPVRVFPAPTYTKGYDGPRTDFRETVYWKPDVHTTSDGTATVQFYLSDAVTSFRAIAEGVSSGGTPGRGEAIVASKMPMTLDAHLPLEVSSGDTVLLPVTLANETDRPITGHLDAMFGAAFKLDKSPTDGAVTLPAGQKQTFFFPLDVVGKDGDGQVAIALTADGLKDQIEKTIRVVPVGFPFQISASGTLKGHAAHTVDLTGALPGTIHASVTMYPSPVASMTQGLQGMIREPGGCFEQTSSSNYPNVMIMSYLGASDAADPALVARTQGMLDKGYKLLTGYETREKGYEWFGQNPGHEALTAYGLLEFEDMAKVYDVDRGMIERTAAWLMSRRDGKGGFLRNPRALDSFGRASYETTNAYIMWAVSEAKRAKGLDAEIDAQAKVGMESKDPYLVALAASTLTNVGRPEAAAVVKRLAAMQGKDGSFPGAKETITMSGGQALATETAALATMALMKAGDAYEGQVRQAVEYLNGHRGGWGEWSSTQATVLALRAMTEYTERSRKMAVGGTATVIVNGREVSKIAFDKGRKEALVWDDLALEPGKNDIEIRVDGPAQLPYSVAIEYRSQRPQSSPDAKIAVETSLARASVKMGEGVKLRAHVDNQTGGGVPMTLARVGIPGGLVYQTWQLKELRDKGIIDFYETRPREVILYWRALAPHAAKDVDIELLAAVPGHYVAPATSSYLYYTSEDKTWAAPLAVSVK